MYWSNNLIRKERDVYGVEHYATNLHGAINIPPSHNTLSALLLYSGEALGNKMQANAQYFRLNVRFCGIAWRNTLTAVGRKAAIHQSVADNTKI